MRQNTLAEKSTVLWAGFAGVLLIMAAMTFESVRSVRGLESTAASLRRETRIRDTLLAQFRSGVYRMSTVARDYLLETDDVRAAEYGADLERTREQMEETLRRYGENLPEIEKAPFSRLQSLAGSYWASLSPALEWNSATRKREGPAFFRETILPRRAELVELSRQVTELNENHLDNAEDRMQDVQAGFRRRIAMISGTALLAGVLVASLSLLRIRRLEREAAERFREVEHSRAELRELSMRLANAQEEERRNLARELHDEIGQSMSAIVLDLGRLSAAAPDNAVVRERVESARKIAESCAGAVRTMALLLRPPMLDELGLAPALNWQAKEVARRSGLKVKLTTGELPENLSEPRRTCVYRIVQEALNNCVKHAQASEVRVTVAQGEGALSLLVEDDGAGFDPGRQQGMGLLGMKERVERLGGRLEIRSKPGHGTAISVSLPLDANEAAPREEMS